VPNTVLAFAEIGFGAIVLDAAIKGDSIANVVRGQAQQHPIGGTSTSSSGSGGGGTGPMASAAGVTSGGGTAIGQVTYNQLNQIGAQHGWTGSQIQDWINVIRQESGGNPSATNPSSGAYGIAQMLGSGGHASDIAKYQQYGGDASSVTGQLVAMANYIKQTYGDPAAAWAHEQSHSWY
jgi:hypothetical protein